MYDNFQKKLLKSILWKFYCITGYEVYFLFLKIFFLQFNRSKEFLITNPFLSEE